MCLVCDELTTAQHWAEVWPGDDRDARLGQHHARLKLLGDVVSSWHLTLDVELGGTAYVVSDAKGRRIVCRNVEAVWSACDELVGTPVDPLDRCLLQALAPAGR